MIEDIGKILTRGFETYTKNLNLSFPFVISIVITGVFSVIMFFIGIVYVFGPSLSSLEYPISEQAVMALLPLMRAHLLEIGLLIIVYLLISLFFQSFFRAGAIGMAKQATETGKSDLYTMVDAGKKNVINFYLAQILVELLYLVGIVFLVPGAMSTDLSQISSSANTGAFLLLMGGFIVWIIYMLVLNIILSIYEYALVVDNLGPVDGVLTGIRFFNKNMFDVFLLWLITGVIVVVLTFFGELMRPVPVISVIWSFINVLIGVLIISPLTAVWWVRLYMTGTDKNIYVNELLAHPNELEKLRANQ